MNYCESTVAFYGYLFSELLTFTINGWVGRLVELIIVQTATMT